MKKIMFNDKFGLTKAVLEGRKTQTRRIVTEPYQTLIGARRQILISVNKIKDKEKIGKDLTEMGSNYSSYKVGDVVAIAQSYKDCAKSAMQDTPGWTNKMFVRADLMPHHIVIERIRIEKLRDISEEDCLAEGIYEDGGDDAFMPRYFYNYENSGKDGFQKPWLAYADLIERISGKGTWNKNPFVFVYDFSLID